VREVPDRRTIRYYTTLGLIDRPAEMRGRTAYYGRRHLLQLVAIKKLQAEGRSLAEIQRALAGLTDHALARVAQIDLQDARIESRPVPRPAARDFWRQEPSIPERTESEGVERGADRRPEDCPSGPIGSQTFHGVPLGDGVTLLLAASRPIDAADLEAIRTAAGPLIETLIRRQLIHPHPEGEPL
jgi:DNA-binding transcriptional MerR regulator